MTLLSFAYIAYNLYTWYICTRLPEMRQTDWLRYQFRWKNILVVKKADGSYSDATKNHLGCSSSH